MDLLEEYQVDILRRAASHWANGSRCGQPIQRPLHFDGWEKPVLAIPMSQSFNLTAPCYYTLEYELRIELPYPELHELYAHLYTQLQNSSIQYESMQSDPWVMNCLPKTKIIGRDFRLTGVGRLDFHSNLSAAPTNFGISVSYPFRISIETEMDKTRMRKRT